MSKQQSKNDSESPNQQIDGLVSKQQSKNDSESPNQQIDGLVSKQQSKNDSESPNQQIDSLVVDGLNLMKYANDDATLDNMAGTRSIFPNFYARLIPLANAVKKKYIADTVTDFRKWTNKTNTKFVNMAGEIPPNTGIFIDNLSVKTAGKLAGAEATYSQKIIHLEKEARRWNARFPELGVNLGNPPQKNAFLLGGLVLFLVAMESIANSRFFAEGSELGLVGGTLTAITVSLGNVLIPLGLAFFGHRWLHRYDSYRNFGIMMIVLFLLWAFGFNHLVAQYRESLVAVAGTGSNDSSTLNYVLLFALGAAVAGISFWKMWSFLDPYKQARKCLGDLEFTKTKYEGVVCADLTEAQKKCNDICIKIQKMNAEIPVEFARVKANFRLVHDEIINNTNSVFSDYHRQYCVMKVGPSYPDRPVVTLTKSSTGGNTGAEWKSLTIGGTMNHPVGITNAEWDFFHEMKTLLDGQRETATNNWSSELHDILKKINDLINSFKAVIIANLLQWKYAAQAV